jgi:hypothetical protein
LIIYLELHGFFKGQIVDDAKFMSQVKWCYVPFGEHLENLGNFHEVCIWMIVNEYEQHAIVLHDYHWLVLPLAMGFSFHMGLENANKM